MPGKQALRRHGIKGLRDGAQINTYHRVRRLGGTALHKGHLLLDKFILETIPVNSGIRLDIPNQKFLFQILETTSLHGANKLALLQAGLAKSVQDFSRIEPKVGPIGVLMDIEHIYP